VGKPLDLDTQRGKAILIPVVVLHSQVILHGAVVHGTVRTDRTSETVLNREETDLRNRGCHRPWREKVEWIRMGLELLLELIKHPLWQVGVTWTVAAMAMEVLDRVPTGNAEEKAIAAVEEEAVGVEDSSGLVFWERDRDHGQGQVRSVGPVPSVRRVTLTRILWYLSRGQRHT
jgi:hypothetical protein